MSARTCRPASANSCSSSPSAVFGSVRPPHCAGPTSCPVAGCAQQLELHLRPRCRRDRTSPGRAARAPPHWRHPRCRDRGSHQGAHAPARPLLPRRRTALLASHRRPRLPDRTCTRRHAERGSRRRRTTTSTRSRSDPDRKIIGHTAPRALSGYFIRVRKSYRIMLTAQDCMPFIPRPISPVRLH